MKHYNLLFLAIFMAFMFGGCASNATLSAQEQKKQQTVDAIVADALFDAGLNDKASYDVSKGGAVNILFTKDVSAKDYVKVVAKLRSNPKISYLYAEQNGNEVCVLSQVK